MKRFISVGWISLDPLTLEVKRAIPREPIMRGEWNGVSIRSNWEAGRDAVDLRNQIRKTWILIINNRASYWSNLHTLLDAYHEAVSQGCEAEAWRAMDYFEPLRKVSGGMSFPMWSNTREESEAELRDHVRALLEKVSPAPDGRPGAWKAVMGYAVRSTGSRYEFLDALHLRAYSLEEAAEEIARRSRP